MLGFLAISNISDSDKYWLKNFGLSIFPLKLLKFSSIFFLFLITEEAIQIFLFNLKKFFILCFVFNS